MRKLDACAPVVSPLGHPVATPRQMGDVTATGTRGARHAAVRATLCVLALILIRRPRVGGQRYPTRRDHGRDPGRVDAAAARSVASRQAVGRAGRRGMAVVDVTPADGETPRA